MRGSNRAISGSSRFDFAIFYIGRIRDHQVEPIGADPVRCRQRRPAIAKAKFDPLIEPETNRVSPRDFKRFRSETSVATIRDRGSIRRPIASAIAPEPVPRSRIAQSGLRAAASSAAATRISVSGRGISTAGITSNSSEKNSLRPRIYAIGSRAARRATIRRKRRQSASLESSTAPAMTLLRPVHPALPPSTAPRPDARSRFRPPPAPLPRASRTMPKR